MKLGAVVFILGVASGCADKTKEPKIAATCDAVVPKVMRLMGDEILRGLPAAKVEAWRGRLTEAFMASCKEDTWPTSVMTCVAAAKNALAVDKCGDEAQNDQFATQMEARLRPFQEEMRSDKLEASGKAPPAAPPPVAAPPPSSGMAECDAWVAAFERYATCDKLAPSDRDAQRLALEQVRASWTGLADEAARKAAAEACAKAEQGVRDAALKMGCAP